MVEIHLLGRPAFRVNERGLTLRDTKGIGLIAYLALEGTQSRDKLSDLLWSDLEQSDARRNLRQRMYSLKRQLPPEWFNADGITVTLGVPFETDVAAFRTHIQAGQDEAAVKLWHGAFLQDLELDGAEGFNDWLEATREHLTTTYLEALRRVATAREYAGDLRGALEAHQNLLRVDELQEFHQRETMRLHALLGERDLALQQFERFTRTLKNDLGEQPLPETALLAEQIRFAERNKPDESLEQSNGTPSLTAPLIGRDTVLNEITRAKAGLTLVRGEPGIGKTRLATTFAERAERALIVRGLEGSSGTALYPIAEGIRNAISEGRDFSELNPTWRTETARLVPEIALEPEINTHPPGPPSPEGRARFLEGLSQTLLWLTEPHGVIMLDDLHWFDALSLELIAHLARRGHERNVRIIATARDTELEANTNAAPILTTLTRDGLLHTINLGPLTTNDVRTLIQALSGKTDAPVFSQRLFDATAGNPLFLLETLRDLFATGELQRTADGSWMTRYDQDTTNYAELPIPHGVREAVLSRVDKLGAATRRLLDVASLAGDGFELRLLSGATALTDWEALEGLERATTANLLETAAVGHRFSHDLIRKSLDGAIKADRRRLIHKRLADGFIAINAPPATIAEHLERGGEKQAAAPWRVKAAELATQVYAYEQALEHYYNALENGLEHQDRYEALASQAQILRTLNRPAEALGKIQEMSNQAQLTMNADLEVRARIDRSEILLINGDATSAIDCVKSVLSIHTSDESNKLRGIVNMGLAYANLGDLEKSIMYFNLALEKRKSCDYFTLGRIYINLSDSYRQINEIEKADLYSHKAMDLFQKHSDKIGIGRVFHLFGLISETRCNYEKSKHFYNKFLEIAEEIESIDMKHTARLNLAKANIFLGNLSDAEFHLDQIGTHELINSIQDKIDFLHASAFIRLQNQEVFAAYEFVKISQGLINCVSNILSLTIQNFLVFSCLSALDPHNFLLDELILQMRSSFSKGIGLPLLPEFEKVNELLKSNLLAKQVA